VQESNITAGLTLQVMDEKAQALQGQVEVLTNEVERLRLRIKELEGQASKNSKNSSKPPSSDGLKKTTSLRVASGKKPGGQAGHAGKTLKKTDRPDIVIRHALPERCDACQATLSNSDAQVHRRGQLFDIPAVRFEVVEYQTLRLRCPCGKLHESEFAPEVCEVAQYGPNVLALAVHLTQGQLLPFARAGELIKDLYGLEISPATLVQWTHEAAQALAPTVEAIVQSVQAAAVVLPNYPGTLVHDCWAPYWSLECAHSLCGAHLLRELIYQKETTAQAWPQGLIELLLAADQACKAARHSDTALQAVQVEVFASQYRALVHGGQAQNLQAAKTPGQRGRAKQSGAFNLLRRMLEREREVLRFVRDLGMPFTNNLAVARHSDAKGQAEDFGLLSHRAGRAEFLHHPLVSGHRAQARLWHASRHAHRLLGTGPGARVGLNSHSDSTVRTHLRSINSKLCAHSRTQAVAIARSRGLIK
jgi:transposase